MSKVSDIILEATTGALNKVGMKFKADGYHGYTDGLHTISVQYKEFIGRFSIEATLLTDPTEDDWFPVKFEGHEQPYIEYIKAHTGPEGYMFKGNFVYVRAKVSREHMRNPQLEQLGVVLKVHLNY